MQYLAFFIDALWVFVHIHDWIKDKEFKWVAPIEACSAEAVCTVHGAQTNFDYLTLNIKSI
jgi:hypothetical protein